MSLKSALPSADESITIGFLNAISLNLATAVKFLFKVRVATAAKFYYPPFKNGQYLVERARIRPLPQDRIKGHASFCQHHFLL